MTGPVPVRDKSIFITGGNGAFGRKFAKAALISGARQVTLFSRDEMKHSESRRALAEFGKAVQYRIGDILDSSALAAEMAGADIVVHAAAMKVLPECEANVTASFQVNVQGTLNTIQAFQKSTATNLIFLSTDKAPYASTAYGAQKFLGEKLVTEANQRSGKRAWSLRYSNVIDSTGAVFLIFRDMLQAGKTVTVNGESTFRGFVSQHSVIETLFRSMEMASGGEVFVLKPQVIRISDLARGMHELIQKGAFEIKNDLSFVGEKESATLVMKEEVKLTRAAFSVGAVEVFAVQPTPSKEASFAECYPNGLTLENCELLSQAMVKEFIRPLL